MSPHDNDPRPVPPKRPSRDDCCKGSCETCVFDVYDDALDRYRSDLQAWEERQTRWKKDVAIQRKEQLLWSACARAASGRSATMINGHPARTASAHQAESRRAF